MKKKRKLLFQVGTLLAVFFAAMILIVGFVIYIGNTSLFLNAKNEMIDRDLLRVKSFVENIPAISSLLDYWHDHVEDTTRDLTEEEIEKAYEDVGEENGYWYVDMPDEEFNRLNEYRKLAFCNDFYNYFSGAINDEQINFNYDAIYCLGIKEGQTGFIYAKGNGENRYNFNSLGGFIDMDISKHRAVQKILSGDFNSTEYEIVDDYNGKSVYAGYAPVVVNGNVKCVICILYDWSAFRKTLSESLLVLAVIGTGIVMIAFVILLNYIYAIAVRPVTHIQRYVREYRETKDCTLIADRMDSVRANNEFGVLATDISELAVEMDRNTRENIRLAGEHEKVAVELDLATKIQEGSLPDKFPAFPDRSEIDIYASMDPAKEVGGDFYDFFFVDSDHLAIVIADVSGKGIPAALFMMASKMLISDRALMGGTPAEVLGFVNERICRNNSADMFVTVLLGILEISTGKLTCVNAGHEYPALERNGKFELFKDKHSVCVGALSSAEYKEYEIRLEKGDCILLYTDGVAEATNSANELYGTERMIDALNEAPGGSPNELIENVRASVDVFVGGAEQFDDITMLCLKYNGSGK